MDRMRFLELFLAESREHLASSYGALSALENEAEPNDGDTLRELLRHGHSLKGMAATMGFGSMVRLAHALEDLFAYLQGAPPGRAARHAPRIHDGLTALSRIVDTVERGQPARSPAAERIARELSQAAGRGRSGCGAILTAQDGQGGSDDGAVDGSELFSERWSIELTLNPDTSTTTDTAVDILRGLGELGRLERVDPPTLSGNPPRFDGRLKLLLVFDGNEEQLMDRLRGLSDKASFRVRVEPRKELPELPHGSPRTWARVRADLLDRVLESVLDLISEKGRALAAADDPVEVRRRLERFGFLLKQLYGTVTDLRLEPFGTVAQRLNQCARQLGADLEKRAQFRIEGSHIQLDRSLLDALVGPLEHMVRNALDHGLEAPEEHLAVGKPLNGELTLTLDRRAGDLVITLQDDGRGLCPDALRRSAIECGLLNEQAARRLTDGEALLLITQPAFSTAAHLTEISGRGVGLDVVRNAIEQLGGRLGIESEPGRGSRFEVVLPLNLALVRALLVRCAGELFALPVSQIEKTLDPATEPAGGIPLPRVRLAERLGLDPPVSACPSTPAVLLMHLPRGPLGLVVDEVIGQRELTVKPLPPPLDALSSYSGAALLEDGSIALVVDPYRLERAD